MNNLTNWLLDKVINHLTLREGCTKSPVTLLKDGSTSATVTDALGFRYEIQVTCVGRLKHNAIDETESRRTLS